MKTLTNTKNHFYSYFQDLFPNPWKLRFKIWLSSIRFWKDYNNSFKYTQKFSIEENIFQTFQTIFHGICIGDICKGLSKELQIVCDITNTFSKELLSIGNLIKHIVSFISFYGYLEDVFSTLYKCFKKY